MKGTACLICTPIGVLLLNFCANHSLSIMKVFISPIGTCTHIGSMTDFVIISSDLQPYFLDTWVKRGAELSTAHHLVFYSTFWFSDLLQVNLCMSVTD